MTLRNIAVNAMRPGFFGVMAEKIWRRVAERKARRDADASRAWCATRAESAETFASALDASLWREAVAFDAAFAEQAKEKLRLVPFDLGGGADCRLLYFLVRHLRPEVVVETGVAAGHSSQTILSALDANSSGRLLSSDFPYFRLEDPLRWVGYLVDERLKHRWTLMTAGDRVNLPRICAAVDRIDLVHYDSDKSAGGRSLALEMLQPRLTPSAVVLMDDIQDNLFFKEYAQAQPRRWRVFALGNKYVGLIGL